MYRYLLNAFPFCIVIHTYSNKQILNTVIDRTQPNNKQFTAILNMSMSHNTASPALSQQGKFTTKIRHIRIHSGLIAFLFP